MKFKITPRQQVVIAGVGFGLLILALIFFLVLPQIVRMGSLRAEESSARQEYDAAKTTLKQLEDIKKSSRKTETELLRLERRAPEEAELPSLMIQIEDTAKKAGISFVSIIPKDPEQKVDYKIVSLEISTNGYFYPLLDFVYRLEKLPRILNVVSIEIKEGEDELPNIETTIKANAYILTPGVAPAGEAKSAESKAGQSDGGDKKGESE